MTLHTRTGPSSFDEERLPGRRDRAGRPSASRCRSTRSTRTSTFEAPSDRCLRSSSSRPAPPTSPRCMAAFRRLGAEPRLARGPADVADASHVMLPGVGTFGAVDGAPGRARAGRARCASGSRPTARPSPSASATSSCSRPATRARACAGSASSPGHVGRFPDDVRVPQFGWNEVRPAEDCRLLEDGYAYFANSYRAIAAPGWTVAHGRRMAGRSWPPSSAATSIGCQFHPELSGAYGEALLSRFLELRLMLTSRIIPCLDVSHGRVVKGVRFQGLRDAGDPAERARLYEDTGRRRDRHPRRLGHARGPRPPARDRAPGARGAVDPAHRRRRRAHGRGRAGTCSRPARTRSRSTPRPSSGRSS